MSYISGGVTISNTVTTKISGSVKTELIDTNARLEAIENDDFMRMTDFQY